VILGRRELVSACGIGAQLAVDPTDSNVVYAGTGGGVKKSTDGGRNWKTVLWRGVWHLLPGELAAVQVGGPRDDVASNPSRTGPGCDTTATSPVRTLPFELSFA
jgi:hypothetical protein